MGLTGFGMNKDEYNRRPRRAFQKIRAILEKEQAKSVQFKITPLSKDIARDIRKKLMQQQLDVKRKYILVIGLSVALIILIGLIIQYI